MHQLYRYQIHLPPCLNRYRYGRNNWSDLTSDDRREICEALEAIQGRRCAYCECDLDQNGQHIEHYRQRSRYVRGTFDWNNLFGRAIVKIPAVSIRMIVGFTIMPTL